MWLVSCRIVAFGFVAILVQAGLVFSEYWHSDNKLALHVIDNEVDGLREGVSESGGKVFYKLPKDMQDRYPMHNVQTDRIEDIPIGYYLKVQDSIGGVIFANCTTQCQDLLFPVDANVLPRWHKLISPGKPISVTGGRMFEIGDKRTVDISVAAIGDPEQLTWRALGSELVRHMFVPMLSMLAVAMGAAIISIRAALKPTIRAARQIDQIDPQADFVPIDVSGMPSEINTMVRATNLAFDRVRKLIAGQNLFASAISHELRTPIAVVRLELEQLDHPGARKAIAGLDDVVHKLEQLTMLARLDAAERPVFRPVALADVASAAAARLAPYVYLKQHSVEFAGETAEIVMAVPALLDGLVSNLIENAVRHTPKGTHIVVRAGPGARVTVQDDGNGMATHMRQANSENGAVKPADGLGLGLLIVRRIAEIHGAALETHSSPGHGTAVTLVFGQ